MSRQEFLKRGGAALAGVAGGSMLAGLSPDIRSARAQTPAGWPGQRYYLEPLMRPSRQNRGLINGIFYGTEDTMRITTTATAIATPPLPRNETVISLGRSVGWSKRIEVVRNGSPTGVRHWATYDPNCSVYSFWSSI